MVKPYPLRDSQLDPPIGWCARCGGELYRGEEEICEKCKEELEDE